MTNEDAAILDQFVTEHLPNAVYVVRRIAEVAEAVGNQAGVGGMETAGMIISYLYEHPDMVERFLREGTGMMIEGDIMPENGCLTFHRRIDGRVTTPQELRAAIMVKNMERGRPADKARSAAGEG